MNEKSRPPDDARFDDESQKYLSDSLGGSGDVYISAKPDLIISTDDKIRRCLSTNSEKMKDRSGWGVPLSIFVALVTTFLFTNFKDISSITADTWKGLYLALAIGSLIWLVYSVIKALQARSSKDVVESIISELKKDSVKIRGRDATMNTYRVKDSAQMLPVIKGRDGSEMILIPGGDFQMGSDSGIDNEAPIHRVYLDAFYMDKYEITNAQYAEFLNEYGRVMDADGNKLIEINESCRIEVTNGRYKPKAGYGDHPVVMVSWYGARFYAEHYGKRLPTEAEWEKAARGGLMGMEYPWGNEITEAHANYDSNGTTSVGVFPPNGYGLYDMAGNVFEWCSDWYNKSYYANSLERNPMGPSSGESRILRGGSWYDDPVDLRVADRDDDFPSYMDGLIGFRCCASRSD